MKLPKIFVLMSGLIMMVGMALMAEEKSESKEKKVPTTIEWMSYDDGLVKAKKTDRQIMVDFTTSWCGWCKKMEREAFSDPEVIKTLNQEFVPVRVDGDSKKELNIDGYIISERDLTRSQFGVRGYPAFWFLESDGSKIVQIRGYKPTGTFKEVLAYINERKYDTTSTTKDIKKDESSN